MHINFNATLLIQVFNFGIAYLLIRVLLLKPAIAVRNQEQETRDAAIELISRRQQQIEQTIYTQHQVWRSCNAYYADHKPEITDQGIFRDLTEEYPVIEITSQEEDKAIKEIASLIEKKVHERL